MAVRSHKTRSYGWKSRLRQIRVRNLRAAVRLAGRCSAAVLTGWPALVIPTTVSVGRLNPNKQKCFMGF